MYSGWNAEWYNPQGEEIVNAYKKQTIHTFILRLAILLQGYHAKELTNS